MAFRRPKIHAQNLWQVSISGYEDSLFFTSVTGLSASRSNEKVADGFSRELQTVVGRVEYGDVTLQKPADPEIDKTLLALVVDECRDSNDAKFDIVLQPVSACGNEPVGEPYRLIGCTIIDFQPGDIDLDGTGVSRTSIQVSPTSIV